MINRILLVSLLLAAWLLPACPLALAAEKLPAGDRAVIQRVYHALERQMQPHLRNAAYNVKAHNGAVVLTGTVPDFASSQKAAAVARKVKGVKSVENRLSIVPPLD